MCNFALQTPKRKIKLDRERRLKLQLSTRFKLLPRVPTRLKHFAGNISPVENANACNLSTIKATDLQIKTVRRPQRRVELPLGTAQLPTLSHPGHCSAGGRSQVVRPQPSVTAIVPLLILFFVLLLVLLILVGAVQRWRVLFELWRRLQNRCWRVLTGELGWWGGWGWFLHHLRCRVFFGFFDRVELVCRLAAAAVVFRGGTIWRKERGN